MTDSHPDIIDARIKMMQDFFKNRVDSKIVFKALQPSCPHFDLSQL